MSTDSDMQMCENDNFTELNQVYKHEINLNIYVAIKTHYIVHQIKFTLYVYLSSLMLFSLLL